MKMTDDIYDLLLRPTMAFPLPLEGWLVSGVSIELVSDIRESDYSGGWKLTRVVVRIKGLRFGQRGGIGFILSRSRT